MKLYIGILLAAIFWFVMFSPSFELTNLIHTNYFWYAMTVATTVLSLFTFINEKPRMKQIFEFKWKYVWIGIGHAIFLYLLSRFGVWIFSELFDWAVPQIQAVYATRSQASPMLIAGLLMFLIGPAEEFFWRGFVQHHLIEKIGIKKGTAIAIALYSFVHIWAFNPMLLLAAFVLGLHWSIIYAKYKSIVPGLISHCLWDVAIFVVLPVTF